MCLRDVSIPANKKWSKTACFCVFERCVYSGQQKVIKTVCFCVFERCVCSGQQKVTKNWVFSELLKNRFKNRLFLCVWEMCLFRPTKSNRFLYVWKTGSKTVCFCVFERGARSSNQKPLVFLYFWKTGSKTNCFCVFERAHIWTRNGPKIRREGEIPVIGYMGSQLGEREPSKLRLVGKYSNTLVVSSCWFVQSFFIVSFVLFF